MQTFEGGHRRAVRMRTAGWVFVWCLFVPGGSAPGYSQTAGPRPPQRVSGGTPLRVEIVGTTNTQAVLAYSAPDSGACTVKVSQQRSMTPLVRDVDPDLFPGSDRDTRPETIAAPTSRIFVVGKRITERASDGRNYSRALEAYTNHYYQVTCGTAVVTGSFITANIPLGMTYNDVPQVDASNPGQWMIPTQLQDRTQTIVDSQTGALLKRVSLDAENSPFLYYGGFVRMCAPTLTGPINGPLGYLCSIPNYWTYPDLLYFIVPATGEVRLLGRLPFRTSVNGTDLSLSHPTYNNDPNKTIFEKSIYLGNFATVADGANAMVGPWMLYNAVSYNQLMKQFDPSFDTTLFGCSGDVPSAGGYALIQCNRSIQDSYGWLGILYGGDGRALTANCSTNDPGCPRVVAAMNVFSAPATRWCSLHSAQMIPGNPLVSITFQELKDPGKGIGTAPMATSLAAAIDASQTSITVAGEPASLATGGDSVHQDAAVGDYFYIGDTYERVIITGITQLPGGQRTWQVIRGNGPGAAQASPAGTVVWAGCKAGYNMGYWKFLQDAHGQDTTNSKVVIDRFFPQGGHADSGPLGRIAEAWSGWAAVFEKVIDHLNEPLSLTIDDSPYFAGVRGFAYGTTTSKHPSYHQDASQTSVAEQHWFLDMLPFDGGPLFSDNPGAVLVSGQLYKYRIGSQSSALARKQLPTLASTGGNSLLDISGPGSQLSDRGSDSYKYCIANVAGECRAESAAGDIFINAPHVKYLYCTGGDGPNPSNLDLCLGNAGAYVQSMVQIYLGTTSTDSTMHSRVVTHGLAGVKDMFFYSTAKSLPDASWALFNQGVILNDIGGMTNVWMAKLPPLSKQDAVDRSTFIRAPISISAPQDQGIASAAIEFGYTEQGEPSQYYCTSRREACVAVSATVDDATPFYYAQTETYTRMPCAKSCTITLPVLPAHVAYYQVRFYDAEGVLVGSGERGVSVEAAVKSSSVPVRADQ
jgi:hypothetical protein